jgi:S1-C subfamily serine protease
MIFRKPIGYLLAAIWLLPVAIPAFAIETSDLDASGKRVAMGEFQPGSKTRGVIQASPELLKGAFGRGFVGPKTAATLAKVRPDRTVRGAKEVQIYKQYSRAAVLILTRTGLGTGTLVSASGDIITNYHVVKGFKEVGVVFKPMVEGAAPSKTAAVRARVVQVDEVADLALIRVERVPAGTVPIVIGTKADISVGDDVHAIGHPTGEAWTYTRGVVSQVRADYEWKSGKDDVDHRANVIQTQTPINPGNSGGPLLTSSGKLAGINSFKAKGEGMNFAIANDEVRRFINTSGDRMASENKKTATKDGECEPKEIYRGTSKDDTSALIGYDIDCDGKAEVELRTPYDIRKPIRMVFDENKDGTPDTIIYSIKRDKKWNYSLRDTDFDGKWDLVCEHEDGGFEPTKCEPYTEEKAK